jgi:hypothetical protein
MAQHKREMHLLRWQNEWIKFNEITLIKIQRLFQNIAIYNHLDLNLIDLAKLMLREQFNKHNRELNSSLLCVKIIGFNDQLKTKNYLLC